MGQGTGGNFEKLEKLGKLGKLEKDHETRQTSSRILFQENI